MQQNFPSENISVYNLQCKVDAVRNDILSRFPGATHTITIRLWDDGTDSVECRYGDEGDIIHRSTFYNGQLTYNSEQLPEEDNFMVVDEFGNEIIMYLTDKKPE